MAETARPAAALYKELTGFMDHLRVRPAGRESEPVAVWSEAETLGGKPAEALVVIFRTEGCYWAWKGGCTMCGYVNDSTTDASPEGIETQLARVLEKHEGQRIAKVYTSGSFFDPHEVPPDVSRHVLQELGARFDRVVVESLPNFLNPDVLEGAVEACPGLEVAIGLESSNPVVLRASILKPFDLGSFVRAAETVHEAGGRVKAYVLVKPPFLTEEDAIRDAVTTARDAAPHSDVLSFNPVSVHKNTLVEYLWKRQEYRPPWLWSLVRIWEETEDLGVRRICHPTGGGTPRGAHNCGACDAALLTAIDDASLGVQVDWSRHDCACRETWLDLLAVEGPMHAPVDVLKFLS